MVFCGKCGKDNPIGAKFCGNCGATLDVAPVKQELPIQLEIGYHMSMPDFYLDLLHGLLTLLY